MRRVNCVERRLSLGLFIIWVIAVGAPAQLILNPQNVYAQIAPIDDTVSEIESLPSLRDTLWGNEPLTFTFYLPKHPVHDCSYPAFNNCPSFQAFWDKLGRQRKGYYFFNCPFPTQAERCWPASWVTLALCKEATLKINLLDFHDIIAPAFLKALRAGELAKISRAARVWEHTNALTMDYIYALGGNVKEEIISDANALSKQEALKWLEVLFKNVAASDKDRLKIHLIGLNHNLKACSYYDEEVSGLADAFVNLFKL